MIVDDLPPGLAGGPLAPWAERLPAQLAAALDPRRHGHLQEWQALIASLPDAVPASVDLNRDLVRIGAASDLNGAARGRLVDALHALEPWRKGPFELFGVHIDAEWRSDWKWARLAPHIAPLAGRTVLDVGCGNGYYALRMVGAGARLVIGIDPTLRYVMQFQALRRYLGQVPVHVWPLGIDDVPPALRAFDTVFSMGVLYHRRAPLDHLLAVRDALRPGGELVLETLVLPDDGPDVLVPEDRYACMRNVWFIPSVAMLERWLRRCGYVQVRTVDVSPTTAAEQRRTPWMTFHSLEDFLDPQDPARTVEGYPAPRRAVVLARTPDGRGADCAHGAAD